MERDEILEKIREITADRLGVDESDVTPEASFREDLDAASEASWSAEQTQSVIDLAAANGVDPSELLNYAQLWLNFS